MLHCHDGDGDDGDNGIGGDDDGDYDGNDDEDDDDGGVGGWALTQLYHVTLPSRHRSSQLHYFTLHYITALYTFLHFPLLLCSASNSWTLQFLQYDARQKKTNLKPRMQDKQTNMTNKNMCSTQLNSIHATHSTRATHWN